MIYLLLFVILWPVMGLAGSDYQPSLQPGDTFEAGDGCNTCTMQGDGVTVLCTLVACQPAQREQPSCYQRMQEAMQSADRYLHGPWNEAWKEYDQWEQTMKDCVEGR